MADEKSQTLALSKDGDHDIHDVSKAPLAKYDPETLEIDHVAEAKLIRKLDIHVIPMVMLLYLFSFLDRVNIGNARLYGMEEDLGLKGDQYQTAVSLLFVTYIITELPSNLVVKKLTPSRWIAFLTVSWGIVATLTGLCQNYAGLIVCRLLLGAFEGGLFPGMAIYLTLFYTKKELGLRVGYLFVSAALAGAFGGLLAYGIGHLDGKSGQRGWRWIMIIEGIPTAVLGILIWFFLADDPENAFYLTPEEKLLMTVRRERQIGHTKKAMEFHKDDMWKALKDWKVWMFCFGQFGVDAMLYGYSTFLPTIIKGVYIHSRALPLTMTAPEST
jgi:sugar phosphate permease